MIRDEILAGNLLEYLHMIEFGLYCQTFFHRQNENLALPSNPIDKLDGKVELETESEPQFESNLEEQKESEHEDDFDFELKVDHEPKLEPLVEIDIEFGPQVEDSLEDEALQKKICTIHRDQKFRFISIAL